MNNINGWRAETIMRASELLSDMAKPEHSELAKRCMVVIKGVCDNMSDSELQNVEQHAAQLQICKRGGPIRDQWERFRGRKYCPFCCAYVVVDDDNMCTETEGDPNSVWFIAIGVALITTICLLVCFVPF